MKSIFSPVNYKMYDIDSPVPIVRVKVKTISLIKNVELV